ncbi:MAG: ABC transporter substrate-binding protein [Candidatus Rokubacteria bacterium]|nr:ABC transporter substrate-binding protein [Candidatus Rokubacteria bacterium]
MLLAPLGTAAQPAGRVPRVGLLCSVTCAGPYHDAFRQGLRELGYMEGRTIAFESRFAAGTDARLVDLAAELARLSVQVIVADSTASARAAKSATGTIPIVMAVSGDAVQIGLVASLARPGGNVTGLSVMSHELSAKLLELFKDAVPGVSRIAVLWNPANPQHPPTLKELEGPARSLKVQL